MTRSRVPSIPLAAWALPASVIASAVFHLVVLLPASRRSYPSDDTLLLIPAIRAGLQSLHGWTLLTYLFAPDQSFLPRAAWKLYAMASLSLPGPAHQRMVEMGIVLHALTSVLVWILAGRLGLTPMARWIAAGLHFTAYAGFHAYLWPVGVQHVITILGILSVFVSYLATEARIRAGRPYRIAYGVTAAALVLSSFSRASSGIGPLALMVHALTGSGSSAERRRRFDRWRFPVLAGLIYPLALATHWGDQEALRALVSQLPSWILWPDALALWRIAPGRIFALGLAVLLALLVATSAVLRWAESREAASRGPGRVAPSRRRVTWWLAGLAAVPAVVKLVLILSWGLHLTVAPLSEAIDSHNTARWHLHTMPVSLVGVGGAVALILILAKHARMGRDALLLLVLFAGFGLTLPLSEPVPIRYWIYVTPALAVGMAAGICEGVRWLGERTGRRAWSTALVSLLVVLVMASNTAAIRVAMWRHKMVGLYSILDYVRAGQLIRVDLALANAPPSVPVCISGLYPAADHPEQWRFLRELGPFKTHNAVAVVGLILQRSDSLTVRVDCPSPAPAGSFAYRADDDSVTRDGQWVDRRAEAMAELSALVGRGDYAAARRLAVERPVRPFLIDELLEGLPDDDLERLTNGWPVEVWLGRIAYNHANWYEHHPPSGAAAVASIRADVEAYRKVLPLIERMTARPPDSSFIRRSVSGLRDRLDTPDFEFLGFVARLIVKDVPTWRR